MDKANLSLCTAVVGLKKILLHIFIDGNKTMY